MEIQLNQMMNSPSSSSSDPNPSSNSNPNSMQSWWEAISKARSRIQILSSILPSFAPISSLADSDRPARSLLESQEAYLTLSSALSQPSSGSGNDPLCQWLYETFQSSDPDLRLVVLSFIPLLTGIYLSRVIESPSSSSFSPSLSGFEAVILSLYSSETKSRNGKPVLISIPDLSQPSLYHLPRNKIPPQSHDQFQSATGVLCPPLEPQLAVKSTKRAFIVSVALDCYYKQISHMPSWSKLELCHFASSWAGQNCSCRSELDGDGDGDGDRDDVGCNGNVTEITNFEEGNEIEEAIEGMRKLGFVAEDYSKAGVTKGVRIPLPWELLQPVLRILGHCLLAPLNTQEVKDAAAFAVRCLYARASHDLLPQAILATRSLIQLDRRMRSTAKAVAVANAASTANTPSKARKPEVLLASK